MVRHQVRDDADGYQIGPTLITDMVLAADFDQAIKEATEAIEACLESDDLLDYAKRLADHFIKKYGS